MEVKLPVDVKRGVTSASSAGVGGGGGGVAASLADSETNNNKMKKPYKHLAVLGTLCCIAALAVLWMAVLTIDWVSIQEPQIDQLELDKLGPYEEPKPHLVRVKFGLFKMCIQNPEGTTTVECRDLDWYNIGPINLGPGRKAPEMPTALIENCVRKLKFTLPFIGLSVAFTSASFLCLTFGHFCQRNKKIIEASMLILSGLCQATALLTFVTQIGSEFEANMPYSHHSARLTSFYRYKYGYSFYLFLLSFSLSELAALFDMAAYFRKFPPNHYVITFHRQEPSPFMATSTTSPPMTMTLPMTMTNSNHHHHHSCNNTLNHHNSLSHHHNNSQGRNNFHTLPNNHNGHHQQQQQQQQQQQHLLQHSNGPLSLNKYQSHPLPLPLPLQQQQQQQHHLQHQQHPDLCNDFNSEHIDLTLASRHSLDHGLSYSMVGNGGGGGGAGGVGGPDQCDTGIMPPQSYISPEVTITTIERSSGYGTIRTNPKIPSTATMESFGTLRKENNI